MTEKDDLVGSMVRDRQRRGAGTIALAAMLGALTMGGYYLFQTTDDANEEIRDLKNQTSIREVQVKNLSSSLDAQRKQFFQCRGDGAKNNPSCVTPVSPGPQGAIGPQGPQGISGINGSDGQRGRRGPRGFKGQDGKNGTPGSDGANGADGTNGLDGEDGAQGPPGSDGKNGAVGPQGPQGMQGPSGVVQVSDSCTPPESEYLTDVSLRYDGSSKTITIVCTSAPDELG